MWNALSTLRVRVGLLVAVPFLVMLGITVYQALGTYDMRLAAAHGDALQSARHLAAAQQRIIKHARHVLTALAAAPAIRGAAASTECSLALSEKLKDDTDFATLIVSLPNGAVICNAVSTPQPINIADRSYFNQALQQRDFVVGEYFISRSTGKPAFGVAYPLIDGDSQLRGVVSASVGLGWLADELTRASLPEGSQVVVVDDRGALLAQYPDAEHSTEKRVTDQAQMLLTATVALTRSEGATVALGSDGKERIYGSARLHRSGSTDVYLLVGIPRDVVLQPAQQALRLTLLVALPLLALTFVAIWLGSDRLFARRIVALAGAAEDLAKGNFTARAEFRSDDDEIGRLAGSFNRMAESLQLKDQQVSRAVRALRVLSAGNRAVMRATDEQTLIRDMCREIIEAGGYRMAWIGYAENNEEKSVRPVASCGADEGFLENVRVSWAQTERGQGPTGRAIRGGIPVTARDAMSDRDYVPWRELAARHGYASSIALPLMIVGEAIGALNIYAREPDAFGEEEVRLLSDAAADLSFGISVQRAAAESKKAETGLRLLSRAVEQSTVSIVITDKAGNVEYVNPHFEAVTGYTKEEILGRNLRILKSGQMPPSTYEDLWRTISAGREWRGELHNRRKNGEPFWEDVSISAIVDETGTIAHFVAVKEDITERRRMQEEIRAAENRYYSLLTASPDGIWIHSEGRVNYVNDALVNMLGYRSNEDIIGRDIFAFFPAEEREALWARVAYTTTELVPTPVTQTVMLRRDASRVEVETTAASFWQVDKPWSIAIIRDVTERRRMENEIRALNEDLERRVGARTAELERTNKELDAFSYSVSHDLRSPLRAIHGFVNLLMEKTATTLGSDERDLMSRIARNAARMSELIDDLLNFSRIGRVEINRAQVDLGPLVAEVVGNARTGYPNTAVVVESLPSASCDLGLIRQVFENLIGNAFKYSGKKNAARIDIGAEIRAAETAFFVRDNGVGFDVQYTHRLFGVFQRLHSDAEFPGTGVGLAIVKRVVERHGGRIWAESAPNAGATFYFTLGERNDPVVR